jgi:demethylmenaquinone methyltransferase/2-methoxy-6-polyprenyl-1,4-benzoquinol methylase
MNDHLRILFAGVAPTYERVNHILTLGFDRSWRKAAAMTAVSGGGKVWLDVCTGTGEMAQALLRFGPDAAMVIAADFCLPMLSEAVLKGLGTRAAFVAADVKRLPFPDASFELVTISFATRNIHLSRDILADTFGEFCRVLRPGGRLVNLETSQPSSRIVRTIFHAYIRTVVKPVGTRISGSRAGYAYLASTIPKFYSPAELTAILSKAGFSSVSFRRLLFGAAAIHTAIK